MLNTPEPACAALLPPAPSAPPELEARSLKESCGWVDFVVVVLAGE